MGGRFHFISLGGEEAAQRDLESVLAIQQVDIVVADFISHLNLGNKYSKKLEAVNTNLRKVEDIVYDLSMLQRSGRSKRIKVASDLSPGVFDSESYVDFA